MRQVDLASRYLQAVGYVRGNRMVCSSIAGRAQVLELGPPAFAGTAGALLRPDVRFPFTPDTGFGVVQIGWFAAIIHRALVIDTAKGEPDVSLSLMSLRSPGPLAARGHVDPRWLARLGREPEAVLLEGGHVIALVRSSQNLNVGIAAVPLHYMENRSDALSLRLVPVGVLAGVVSLELDYLKIDRSFIEAIGTGAPTSQVVGHIIGMAWDLGLRMIAEGVQSRAQADFLLEHGVQYAQGWLFGQPMSFAAVLCRMEQMAQEELTPATG